MSIYRNMPARGFKTSAAGKNDFINDKNGRMSGYSYINGSLEQIQEDKDTYCGINSVEYTTKKRESFPKGALKVWERWSVLKDNATKGEFLSYVYLPMSSSSTFPTDGVNSNDEFYYVFVGNNVGGVMKKTMQSNKFQVSKCMGDGLSDEVTTGYSIDVTWRADSLFRSSKIYNSYMAYNVPSDGASTTSKPWELQFKNVILYLAGDVSYTKHYGRDGNNYLDPIYPIAAPSGYDVYSGHEWLGSQTSYKFNKYHVSEFRASTLTDFQYYYLPVIIKNISNMTNAQLAAAAGYVEPIVADASSYQWYIDCDQGNGLSLPSVSSPPIYTNKKKFNFSGWCSSQEAFILLEGKTNVKYYCKIMNPYGSVYTNKVTLG